MGVYRDGGLVKGKVKSVVKGGLMVNVGVEAFLPGSQVDIIPPRDLNEYVGKVYEFKIVKVNDDRKNIVLSRREVIEAERADQRQRFLETVKEGDKVEGLVKNITGLRRLCRPPRHGRPASYHGYELGPREPPERNAPHRASPWKS